MLGWRNTKFLGIICKHLESNQKGELRFRLWQFKGLSLSMCLLSLVSKVIPGNEVGKVLDDVKNQLHWHHESNSTIQQVIVQLSVLQRTYNWPHRQVIGEEFALSSDYYHPIKKQYTHSRSLRQELSSDTLQSPSTGEYLRDANSNRRYISLQR